MKIDLLTNFNVLESAVKFIESKKKTTQEAKKELQTDTEEEISESDAR